MFQVRPENQRAPIHVPTGSAEATSLAGKVVLITGGAGGLGAAMRRAVTSQGAHAVAADIDYERAIHCAQELTQDGRSAIGIELDVGREESVTTAFDTVFKRFGRIDAVVNNAAIDVTLPLEELTTTDWERVLRTNLTGPFLVARFAVPDEAAGHRRHREHRLDRSEARLAERRGLPRQQVGPARTVARAACGAARRRHRVTAIVAGGMRTPFLLDRFPELDPQKLQDPVHVARAVCFALSQPATR